MLTGCKLCMLLPVSGFSLASFTSLEAGNRKSDITICNRGTKVYIYTSLMSSGGISSNSDEGTYKIHIPGTYSWVESYQGNTGHLQPCIHTDLNKPLSSRLASNLIPLYGTPECEELYQQ